MPSSRHSVVLLWSPIRKARGPSRWRSHLLLHGSPETPSPVSPSAATAGNGTVRRRSRPRPFRTAKAWLVVVLFWCFLHTWGGKCVFCPSPPEISAVISQSISFCAVRLIHHVSTDISPMLSLFFILFFFKTPAIFMDFRGELVRLPFCKEPAAGAARSCALLQAAADCY